MMSGNYATPPRFSTHLRCFGCVNSERVCSLRSPGFYWTGPWRATLGTPGRGSRHGQGQSAWAGAIAICNSTMFLDAPLVLWLCEVWPGPLHGVNFFDSRPESWHHRMFLWCHEVMQIHHVSWRTFSALAMWTLSVFVHFAHQVSIGQVPSEPHLECLAVAVSISRSDSYTQLHHVSRRTFSAFGVWSQSAFDRIIHWLSIGQVPSEPHLELQAGEDGMGRGSQHGQEQ